jgi:hypothetical protein
MQSVVPTRLPAIREAIEVLYCHTVQTPLHNGNANQTPPLQAAEEAAGWDRAVEVRTGLRQTLTCCDTPATAILRRGHQLTTLQPTKRQPPTVGEVDWGGESHDCKENDNEGSPRLQPPAHIRTLVMH